MKEVGVWYRLTILTSKPDAEESFFRIKDFISSIS